MQIYVSIRHRDALAVGHDPWDGRTLEWSTSSPPPHYNFAFTPMVHERDAWTDMKARGYKRPLEGFKPIHMPKSTGRRRDPGGAGASSSVSRWSGTSGGWPWFRSSR